MVGEVAGTLNQGAGDIEKLIRHPLQRNAQMRAVIAVNMHFSAMMYGKHRRAIQFKAFG